MKRMESRKMKKNERHERHERHKTQERQKCGMRKKDRMRRNYGRSCWQEQSGEIFSTATGRERNGSVSVAADTGQCASLNGAARRPAVSQIDAGNSAVLSFCAPALSLQETSVWLFLYITVLLALRSFVFSALFLLLFVPAAFISPDKLHRRRLGP